jgi:peptidoglycan hydrolase CwlO-like protein
MAINNVSFWQQNETWRARQKDLSDQLDELTALTETIASANAALASSKANLAAEVVIKRLSAEAKAKVAAQEAAAAKLAAEEHEMDALEARMEVPAYIKALAAKVNFTV